MAASFRRSEAASQLTDLDRWELSHALRSLQDAESSPDLPFPLQVRSPLARVASQIREILGFKQPPYDTFRAIYQMGIRLEFTALESLAGALLRQLGADKRSIILVNSDQPDDRLRWSAMHELVHLALGHNPQAATHIDAYGPARRREDKDADQLAGELLMPLQDLVPHLATTTTPAAFYELSDRFRVSYAAMVIRFQTLGALSAQEAARLREAKPTEPEERLGLKSQKKGEFDPKLTMPGLVKVLEENGQLPKHWELDFSLENGPRYLRLLQSEAIKHYVLSVDIRDRASPVNKVFEDVAMWLAKRHPWQ